MSAAITLGMLRAASRAEFPVIDLAAYPPRSPATTYGEYRVWWLNANYGAKLNGNNALQRNAQRPI